MFDGVGSSKREGRKGMTGGRMVYRFLEKWGSVRAGERWGTQSKDKISQSAFLINATRTGRRIHEAGSCHSCKKKRDNRGPVTETGKRGI